jgi:uncharacterized protein (TIGR01244 family)
MDYAQITPSYAVAPQIDPADAEAIREAGFTDVICNRPDEEVPPELAAGAVEAALTAAGLRFHLHPVRSGALTASDVERQAAILAEAGGPVLAYCRSGSRCSILWALAEREMSADEIVEAAGRAGYDLSGYRKHLGKG